MADQLSRSRTRVTGFADPEVDFQLLRQLGAACYGGASVGETLGLVPLISGPADWVDQFERLALRQQADANQRGAKGHAVSARDGLLRAASSFRAAEYFSPFGTDRHAELGLASQRAFEAAMRHAVHGFEDAGYHLDGRRLPAYWLSPDDVSEPGPAVLVCSGFDGTLEELYFEVGLAALERGWRVLQFAGPGQMDTARRHPELSFVPDTERWVSAALDTVLARGEVDPGRVALVGISYGGYFAARAAAHDARLKALVANSPIVDLHQYMVSFVGFDPETLSDQEDFGVADIAGIPDEQLPPPLKEMSRMLILRFGQRTLKETFHRLREFVIDDLSAITCPSLALVGDGEGEEPIAQLERFRDGVGGPVATRTFTTEEGADTHCQMGNLALSTAVIFDWLEETFSWPGARLR
jgi:pimeloyl-ACP methyl ester carboxylesterase